MTDFARIGRRSKSKGKQYEARIAELFMKKTDVAFRRTPNSGGLSKQGGVVVAGRTFCGDLICDRPDFNFSVEAKNRKCFSFMHVLKNLNTADLTSWWMQSVRDSYQYSLHPIMVFKPEERSRDNVVVLCKDPWAKYIKPNMVLNGYEQELNFTVHEKAPGARKGENHKVRAILPVPILLSWEHFHKSFNNDWLFDKSITIVKEAYNLIEYK